MSSMKRRKSHGWGLGGSKDMMRIANVCTAALSGGQKQALASCRSILNPNKFFKLESVTIGLEPNDITYFLGRAISDKVLTVSEIQYRQDTRHLKIFIGGIIVLNKKYEPDITIEVVYKE